MIDIHRLAVLQRVAQYGSFAGAAAVLHHTPSAVSQQIAALERSAGMPLVTRSTRGVTLTDAGRTLLATADAITGELAAAEQQLQRMKDAGPDHLTVVTFPSAGEPLLAPALAQARLTDLPTDLTVMEAEPETALPTIKDGTADLAIIYHFHSTTPPRTWAKLGGPGTYVPLVAEPFRLLVSSQHPAARRKRVALEQFADDPWIQGWGAPGSVLDTLAATAGFVPQVACRASDYRFMTALAAAGVGVCLVPQLAIPPDHDARELLLDPVPTRHIGVYLPRRRWSNPAAHRLLHLLQERAAQLAKTNGIRKAHGSTTRPFVP